MKIKKVIFEIFAILIALIVSIPIYLVVINTFKTHEQIIVQPLAFPTFAVGFDNIIKATEKMDIFRAYSTTLSIELIAVFIGIFFSSLAAYAVSRIKHRLFSTMYWIYLGGIMIPIQSAFIPLVYLLKSMGLNNTLLGISIVYAAIISPFAIFVFSGFMRTIPMELEEAAYIDGSSPFRTYFQIIFPLIKPVTATLFILQFIYVWNDLLLPLVLVSTRDYPTVSVSLYKFFGMRGQSDFSLLYGGVSLALAPIIILFLSFQRFFVKGLATGAIKG
jgi:raffinose/stachyose/melibiose transport system permease protein